MLFFGPSFSHLVCYFIYFLQIQVNFSKSKKVSLVSPNSVMKIRETAVLIIFNVIYVNVCDCELSPNPGGNYMCSY